MNGQAVKFRAYENVVYVRNPVDTRYEIINIYVPEAYYNGGEIDGFTAETAPIFLPNQIGGYMPAEPGKPALEGKRGEPEDGQKIAERCSDRPSKATSSPPQARAADGIYRQSTCRDR